MDYFFIRNVKSHDNVKYMHIYVYKNNKQTKLKQISFHFINFLILFYSEKEVSIKI